ncbi:uncharacterized protein LTR77_007485 [Saxophila tyrrhenica]|uniref:AB hydrolase-1 domain-containing protein n=1 Tax=Saxophila tyrrhenica TaxID=1690608 RepID=A0AAV9P4W1_9PEZI|nr:hypothetical protein LTR77_007485 [Saxophila tyrrhenica]
MGLAQCSAVCMGTLNRPTCQFFLPKQAHLSCLTRLIRWRHIVPQLKDKISLFIPELPGYGFSSLPPKSDKRTVGNLIFEALQDVFGKDRPVIYCGHDRGARVGHRLIVDNNPAHNIKSAILMDIVPTLEQFRAFANPKAVIEQMGGGYWTEANLARVKGGNEQGIASFKKDGAWDHYCYQFSMPDCISGSCADYQAGATIDVEEQEADQEAGRMLKIPTFVIYSASNLGRMHDVPEVWEKWNDGELKTYGVPDGYGHFLPEECPDIIAQKVIERIDDVGK